MKEGTIKEWQKEWKKYKSRENNLCRSVEGGCWRRVKATVCLPSALIHYNEWLQAARMCSDIAAFCAHRKSPISQ